MTDEGVESIAKQQWRTRHHRRCYGHASEHISYIKDYKGDDRYSSPPLPDLSYALWILRFLDFHGFMPKVFMDNIPLYSSVFVSHMGSLGAEAPFHHLYEFGTTSIFCTIGKIYKKPYQDVATGEVVWKKTIDISFSIDERICDGFYLIKSLRLFEQYIENPSLLEKTPIEMDLEHKQKLRQHRDFDPESASFLSDYWDNMMDEADQDELDSADADS